MNRLHPGQLMGRLRQGITTARGQRFFQDRLSLAFLVPVVVLNGLTLIIMLLRLKPVDYAVPVRYSSLIGFDALGPWYQIYTVALFGILVTLVNTTLASISFTRSRITSFFLLIGAFVVGLFCLIIGTAFAVII
jgi:hypothetical protein